MDVLDQVESLISTILASDKGEGFVFIFKPSFVEASETEEKELDETKPDPDDPYAVFRDAAYDGPNYGGGGGEDAILMDNPSQP